MGTSRFYHRAIACQTLALCLLENVGRYLFEELVGDSVFMAADAFADN